jgi:hypothetical protein
MSTSNSWSSTATEPALSVKATKAKASPSPKRKVSSAQPTKKKAKVKKNKNVLPSFIPDSPSFTKATYRVQNPYAVYNDGTKADPVELTRVQMVVYDFILKYPSSKATLKAKSWFYDTDQDVHTNLID